jgi:hypothetical protein
MTQIIDVSPTASNTSTPSSNHSVIGRMLSIACSPDGQALYTGSYSNLWSSTDGGRNFDQLTWPQPAPNQFDAPGSLGGWCVADIAVSLGWRVENDPRMLAKLTPRGWNDIVGFGECGVWTALSNGAGSFQPARVVLNAFGLQAGGWQVDKHPRMVVDLTGDGCGDIVGFGDAGVWTAIGNRDGTFQAAKYVLANFGYQQGWRVESHPRFVAVLTKSGHADLVGFGDAGVWTALGNGDGTFQEPKYVLANFGVQQGWQVDKHPRLVVDLTGDGHADLVGFGDAGVWTALGKGDGTFQDPQYVLANFGVQQGWQVDKHVRVLANLASSGHPDIVGFGDLGVWTALGNGNGTFQNPNFVLQNFGTQQGWQVDKHPRFLAKLTASGHADIIGFGDAGVWTAVGNGNGTFQNLNYVLANFGVQQGWQVNQHPRFMAVLTGNRLADIVGFGNAGVWTALSDGHGGFPASNFVMANFGYQSIVLALMTNDRVAGSKGIWRSPDGGSTWTQVHRFPAGETVGQLVWALGSDHLVYAAGGSSLAISKDAGATFVDALPWGTGPAKRVNHVAVWQNAPSDSYPAVIYALGNSTMFLSFDGGTTWMEDQAAVANPSTFPPNVGGAVSTIANSNTPTVMVISPKFVLEVFICGNGSGANTPPAIWRGDYSQFPFGNKTSTWDAVVMPNAPGQDSGNVFLATTQKFQGDLLFYGSQRPVAFVGPLYPTSASDWHALDNNVHYDLHGILLSPDFSASIQNGNYTPATGTVWMLADGGIYWSTNGGNTFTLAHNAKTLSLVNFAGVSIQGKGAAFSLNTGDNDGFYSVNGGANWSYQQYGGGDNDCSFADPLRPYTMMVFTPRWDTAANGSSARDGQTVAVYEAGAGNLADARAGTNQRRAVTGPPTAPPSAPGTVWNANSFFGSRGSRPIVLGLPGEPSPTQGDYIFILFNATGTVLVRTQNIWDIQSRNEWITTATGPGQGARVYLQGPPLPVADLGVTQASGGHGKTVFYVGGDSSFSLWKWTPGMPSWLKIVPSAGAAAAATAAVRFFVDPYRPNLIYILDRTHVRRSDDGGKTWVVDAKLEAQLTWGGKIAFSSDDNSSGIGDHFDLILTDMQFHPSNALVRFAVGEGGAFYTNDGVNWIRLLHSGAFPGRPSNCYFDWISVPSDPALYAGFAGRSLVKIDQLPGSTVV